MTKLRLVGICLATLILLPVCVFFAWPTAWDDEEYAVYSALIEKEFIEASREERSTFDGSDLSVRLVVIEDYTDAVMMHKRAKFEYWIFPESLLKTHFLLFLWQRTNLDFAIKNRRSYRLENKLKLTQPYTLLPMGVANRKYSEMSPNAAGPLVFSRVGFNWKKDRAIVYYDSGPDFFGGSGWYVFLSKKDGVWQVDERKNAWIS